MRRRSSSLKSENSALATKVQPIGIAALIRGLGLQTHLVHEASFDQINQPLELADVATGRPQDGSRRSNRLVGPHRPGRLSDCGRSRWHQEP